MQQLQGQAKQLLAELYDDSPPYQQNLTALLTMRTGNALGLSEITLMESEVERLKAEKVTSPGARRARCAPF